MAGCPGQGLSAAPDEPDRDPPCRGKASAACTRQSHYSQWKPEAADNGTGPLAQNTACFFLPSWEGQG
jgi:hypothetical protein